MEVRCRQSQSKSVCLSVCVCACVYVSQMLCAVRDISFRQRSAPDYERTVVPIAAVAHPLRFFETLSLVRQFLCLLIAS